MSNNKDFIKFLKNIQYSSVSNINLKYNKVFKEFSVDTLIERNENDNLKNDLINERTLRINIESNTQNLSNKLMKIETHLTQIRKENEKIKLLNNNNINGKEINKIKNDKLKNQVILLESQNDNLIKEIDEILYEDKKMKNILQRI